MSYYPVDDEDVAVPVQIRYDMETGFDMLALADTGPMEDPISLELTEPLPQVCTEHGLPAVEHRSRPIVFQGSRGEREQATPGAVARSIMAGMIPFFKGPSTPNTTLHGEWPLCSKCLRHSHVYRGISVALVSIGLIAIAGIFVASQVGVERIPPWVFVAIFLGWLPFGLSLAMLAYDKSTRFVSVRPITDLTTVTIRAHPNFAAALAQND